jgi:preprotein translocase subunit SecF
MMNIIGKRLWFFIISAILMVACIVSLAVFRLNLGIDFAGGSQLTLTIEQNPKADDVAAAIKEVGFNATVEKDDQGNYHIRTIEITDEQKNAIETALTAKFGAVVEREFNEVNTFIGRQTTIAALWAIGGASVAILLYMAWAFRKMPKPFHYGSTAVFALVHDILLVLGVFAVLGKFADWTVDLSLVIGILTVLGYAVNDTIVVFDRIRENQRRYPGADFGTIINTSLTETITRSLITGVGVLFVLLALYLFIGPAIRNLVVVLLIGIYFGTYTSLFVASPLLYVWETKNWGSLSSKKEPSKQVENARS